ncbi:unnamed protein product [Prorocentrum cordatum]|uniref:WW domain-containing protein n=1 Tax=Prorocentrum cordatum TaxID=2364126 RepID=A0ABN9QMB3_9DINO|nr:unnamed protein product [Polarella glacialis]
MTLECSGCKKLVSEGDFGSCYSVYRCRKHHIFINCCSDCHRTFEKRCDKVLCCAVKQQHKLNKDGQTSALRKLPPCERDKFKQLSEAQQAGLMICPEEVKASERSVPHCAHILSRSGGTGQLDGAIEQDTQAPPPPARQVAPQPMGSEELLGDDMLVALPKDCEGADELVLGKKKKKAPKHRRDRKGTPISLDYNFGARPGDQEWAGLAGERPPALQTPPPSPPAGYKHRSSPPQQARPQKSTAQGEQGDLLPSTPACPSGEAGGRGPSHGTAAVERLRQVGTPARSQAEQPSGRPGRGEGPPARAALADVPQRREPGAAAAEASPCEARPVPRPCPPGPAPALPEGWRAVWCQEHSALYFWHTPSDQTTWDPPGPPSPAVDAPEALAASAALARAGPQESAAVSAGALGAAGRAVERAAAGAAGGRAGGRDDARVHSGAGVDEERGGAAGQRFVCSRHWRPKAEFTKCLRLLHGECVCVSWEDGREDGWAYGRALDDQTKEGYFPRAVLRELEGELRPRAPGERLSVCDSFDTPESVGGYVFAQPGDTLRVLHPMEEPYVWAYVEREGPPGVSELGWVPAIIFGEAI